MTLAVEPGSYTSWSAALPSEPASTVERSFGSKPGALARASSSPVLVFCTTTYPPSALDASTCSLMARWAAHWMSRSMVSSTSVPSTAGISLAPAVGTRRPPDWAYRIFPSWPESSSFSWDSRPPPPLPSALTKPSIPAARSPFG